MTDQRMPEAWTEPLAEVGRDPKVVDPPDGAGGDWFEVYSQFATRGFVRAIVEPEDGPSIRLQLALPTGTHGDREVLQEICSELTDLFGGAWEIAGLDPDWRIDGELDAAADQATVAEFLRRLEQLGEAAASETPLDVDWLRERLSSEETETDRDNVSTSRPGDGADVFESIGDNEPGSSTRSDAPSGMLEGAGIASFEIGEEGEQLEVRVGLDTELPVRDREQLGRGLAHALQARYDLDVRPLQPEDEAGALGESLVRLMVQPADIGIAKELSPDELRTDVESYFDRLERFDGMGVKLADVLGLGSEPRRSSSGVPPRDRVDAGKRGGGRREDRSEDREASDEDEKTPQQLASRSRRRRRREEKPDGAETDDEETGVVLGVGPEPSSRGDSPASGLEAGNYRDPRLLREDATTSLVDVVLRHPGYAERKMGHNLSILLDADYPDAMELVESAPCVIAWGVSHERGKNFKGVIERAGGKVVLVEPDSLSE